MGLNSPGGENLLIFSSCGRCSRLTMGTLGTRSGGLRKCQSPCELLGGHLGFLYRRCRALRPCVDSVPETEDSSPVLTCILGYFWSLLSGVSPRLKWGHARTLSSRAVAAVSRIPSRGSRDQWLSLEAFPLGFPTRLSHMAVPRATMVLVNPRLESGGSAGKTVFPGVDETSGGLCEWWHVPGVPLAFLVESASS